jgi:hypothetical protein
LIASPSFAALLPLFIAPSVGFQARKVAWDAMGTSPWWMNSAYQRGILVVDGDFSTKALAKKCKVRYSGRMLCDALRKPWCPSKHGTIPEHRSV